MILWVPDPLLGCHGVHGVPSPDTLQPTELLLPERRVKSAFKKMFFFKTNFEFPDTLLSTELLIPERRVKSEVKKSFFF
jgi:hypothetical protein